MEREVIRIRGAREHNLKNIDVDLPKNKLIAVSGLSGSGKSSLAFDTIYVEGHRRYIEGLSSYAKQFLGLRKKPDIDSIEGLSPAISVNQKFTKTSRSTISTATDIHDYLRLMYAKIGIPHSPCTGKPLVKLSSAHISEIIASIPEGTVIYTLAPLVFTNFTNELSRLLKLGYTRVKVNGSVYTIDEASKLKDVSRASVITSEISLSAKTADSLSVVVKKTLSLGKGVLQVEIVSLHENSSDSRYAERQILTFSEHYTCPESGFTIKEIGTKLFSFNVTESTCKSCGGSGKEKSLDINLIVPNKLISVLEGALDPVGSLKCRGYSHQRSVFAERCSKEILVMSQKYHFDIAMPWNKMDAKHQNIILSGNEHGTLNIKNPWNFKGVIGNLNESGSAIAERYYSYRTCKICDGQRLGEKGLCVKIAGKNIGDLCSMSISELIDWFGVLPEKLTNFEACVSSNLVPEIVKRLNFVSNIGLGHLSLGRDFSSLSGGEIQRVRLASLIGSGLSGVIYVLDEPSVGLHQRDNSLLINSLKNLRNLLNTVLVIEHDLDTISSADHILDLGPGAGKDGGMVVAQGSLQDIVKHPDSITGKYLSGKVQISVPQVEERKFTSWIKIKGARKNNLKNVDVDIPIGGFTCITGVSGSGKSSLIKETLYPFALSRVHGSFPITSECDSILGLENIDKVIEIDQSPIGRTSTSNPATYVGLFMHIRSLFASLPLAKSRGYSISRFSFNTPGGRCETCKGEGSIKIEMHFLPDIYVKCEGCDGRRYNRETLEVTYKKKSIADVLEMSVDQALDFFTSATLIQEKLESLKSVGMGYIKIGQHSTTLSGGESQRIKLSKELSKRSTGNTLYLLDEPTTGLHISDVQNLLQVLHSLAALGNTIIVVEHNLHVVKTADYVIDIGPEGGALGGRVVGYGSPKDVANSPNSITGKYLKSYLD